MDMQNTLSPQAPGSMQPQMPPQRIDPEAEKKLEQMKTTLDKFSKKLEKKLQKYLLGVALLPPSKEEKDKDKINVLVLVEDSDSILPSKDLLKEKLDKQVTVIKDSVDKTLLPQVMLVSELWQHCYDQKLEVLQDIAMSAPIYDTGYLSAVKISEIHKTMVLKKFEKYIVSYVLAGSLVQGKATAESDIDVFVVIDDTDVKKMTRVELKDKLRSIIIGMGMEASQLTGIKKAFNIQVYILTDFWDFIKDANPVIFTFLRDGVPLYDRGIFMPWKQLLKMGKIKPSQEAIDQSMQIGDQMLNRVSLKLKEIALEDFFWSILSPSQAALMHYGIAPPTPKETPILLRQVFVKKDKLLEDKYVQILENIIKTRKDLEHDANKKVTGAQIDKLLKDSEEYLKRINKLFDQISKKREDESVIEIYDSASTVLRDALKTCGVSKVADTELETQFKKVLVEGSHVPQPLLRAYRDIAKAKKDFQSQKLTKAEVAKVKKVSGQFIRNMVEFIQRKRAQDIEKTRIRVQYDKHVGEVLFLGKQAFVIKNIEQQDKDLSVATVGSDGAFVGLKPSSYVEFEKALSELKEPAKVLVKEKTFEELKKIFGKDVEIMISW